MRRRAWDGRDRPSRPPSAGTGGHTYTYAHTHARTHMHARTHTHTHARTHTGVTEG